MKKMKNGMPPKEHSEKSVSQLPAGNLKYCEGMNGGEDLQKSVEGLVGYVKKNRPKK